MLEKFFQLRISQDFILDLILVNEVVYDRALNERGVFKQPGPDFKVIAGDIRLALHVLLVGLFENRGGMGQRGFHQRAGLSGKEVFHLLYSLLAEDAIKEFVNSFFIRSETHPHVSTLCAPEICDQNCAGAEHIQNRSDIGGRFFLLRRF